MASAEAHPVVVTVKSEEPALQELLAELRRAGVLLLSDARLPSVAGLIAGEPIRGSWWAHPRGHAIFRAAGALAGHPDVVLTKLVSGKVTFVHRRLWPALLGAVTAGESWQNRGLPGSARAVLAEVSKKGVLRTDRLRQAHTRKAARDLEDRLLVHSEEFHTETGAHAKRLESWPHWARRVGFNEQKPPAGEAMKELEEALRALNARFGAAGRLPWQGGVGRGR